MKTRTTSGDLEPRLDRRRSPRFPSDAIVLGRLVPEGTPVRVMDIGFGGFMIESAAPFPIGSLRQVRLYSVDGTVDVVVTGAVVHSRRDSATAPRSRYVSGFSLVGPHHWTEHAEYDRLIDMLAGAEPSSCRPV